MLWCTAHANRDVINVLTDVDCEVLSVDVSVEDKLDEPVVVMDVVSVSDPVELIVVLFEVVALVKIVVEKLELPVEVGEVLMVLVTVDVTVDG